MACEASPYLSHAMAGQALGAKDGKRRKEGYKLVLGAIVQVSLARPVGAKAGKKWERKGKKKPLILCYAQHRSQGSEEGQNGGRGEGGEGPRQHVMKSPSALEAAEDKDLGGAPRWDDWPLAVDALVRDTRC